MENVMNLFRLDAKVAVVTGGAGLYGTSISTALAEAGAKVIIASRNKKSCQSLAESLIHRGYEAEGMELDQGDEASVVRFVREIAEQHGRIDILVNNAVSRVGMATLDDMTVEDWEAAQRINTTGLMLLTREAVRVMVNQEDGVVINIGSIQGAVGPNFEVYGSTGMTSPVNYTYDKWGMVGFTKWLSNYYGKHGIRANCISPGGYGPGVKSRKDREEFIKNYERLTPLRRFANENDIKGPIVFLASDASSYVTGHNLLVDGGWTAW